MKNMKNNAIVGITGHFDNKIDIAGLEGFAGINLQKNQASGGPFRIP